VFHKLAMLLVTTQPTRSTPKTAYVTPATVAAPSAGRVIVVGGVAIDHTWHLERLPEVETSKLAMNYSRAPGGKGLSQAVAAARLGLEVALIAAVTDDREGQEIVEYLESESVDTSMVKCLPGLVTPATAIFEQPRGESAAAVWRSAVELDIQHLDKHAGAVADCDVVLLTFEVPRSVMHHTLNLASGPGDQRPAVIVTPGQPYPDGGRSTQALAQIDYLVAHTWELVSFADSPGAAHDPRVLSAQLLDQGLRSLCLLENRGGTIYLPGEAPIAIPATFSLLKESAITRDAFCAALAARLIGNRSLTDDAIQSAAAAMASFAEGYSLASYAPRRSRSTPG
jgi:ribokinase